ncbi:MAG: hypothetical protein GYB31_04340 [Bacteroidetes bacterium]|nr:hypothetical protein [Bacteroidota bacterium]
MFKIRTIASKKGATSENLLLLAFLNMAILLLIMPVALADLKSLSGGFGGLANRFYFRPDYIFDHFQGYGEKGRELYAFMLITAALAARICTALLAYFTGIRLMPFTWPSNIKSAGLLPGLFLAFSLAEILLLLILLSNFPRQIPVLTYLTILCAWLKWLSLSVLLVHLLINWQRRGFRLSPNVKST